MEGKTVESILERQKCKIELLKRIENDMRVQRVVGANGLPQYQLFKDIIEFIEQMDTK